MHKSAKTLFNLMRLIQNILICYFLIVIFFGCNKAPNSNDDKIESPSTIKEINQESKIDTLISEKEILMYNEIYTLKIIEYRLNDSDMFKENNIQNKTDILLIKAGEQIFSKQISKETFKDSLPSDFLSKSILGRIEYKSVRTNRLYFNTAMAIPETDQVYKFEFAIFYKTNQLGRLDFWPESEVE